MFVLADCNNFFASCEEVFNPKLANRALIILSNNDGCVIARSKKAKELGIKMGDPAFLHKERVERGEIDMLSSNFTLYADMSLRVMQTMESFSPKMEIYSIDEAFFEIEELPKERIEKEAIALRQKVKKWTGLPISIGIAPTKTLAKIANDLAKKHAQYHGVCALLDPSEIRLILEQTDLEEIWGIGANLAHRLKCKRIYTAAQLIDSDDQLIRKILGISGYRTTLELRAISCLPCIEVAESKKSIVCSRSFKEGISDLDTLSEAISSFASRASEKLREQNSRAGFLSVFIATSPFIAPYEARSCPFELCRPTSYTPELIRLAKEGLMRIYRKGFTYKKAGIMLGQFIGEGTEQIDYLTTSENPKKHDLMKTIDRINSRYDKKAVQFAAEGINFKWLSARRRISPRYTTAWNELLRI